MALHQIEENIFLGNPFIYRLKPELYPGIINAVLIKPHLFDDIARLKNEISDKSEMENKPGDLEGYFHLVQKDVPQTKTNVDNIIKILESVEEYKLLFKEMGASLKFNPLSRNKSAIQIRERAKWLIDKFGDLIKPKAIARFINVKISDGCLYVDGTDIEFKSKKLSGFFDEPGENRYKENELKQMVIYVVTIGNGIDDTVKLLGKDGEMFDSYILNGIGAAAAEMVAEDLNYYLNDTLKNGKAGMQYYRFSPGYGDWWVNDQVKLFKLLRPDKHIGVILNEGNIMLPEKSTSGIMGLKEKTNKQIFHSGNE